ncbi:MAG: GtrA family protein, partial [Bacillota bacterium]
MKKIADWFRTEFFTKETLTYLLIGLTSTAINWTGTYILNNVFGIGYWVTSILMFLLCLAFSYFMNKRYAFRNTQSEKETLPRYLIEVLICFVLSYGLGKMVLDRFF